MSVKHWRMVGMMLCVALSVGEGCFGVGTERVELSELREKLREGDIIFQKSMSRQSEAIRQATGSEWTHVGVVVQRKSGWRVLEASGKGVTECSLAKFVEGSHGRCIAVRRLRDEERVFTPEVRRKFQMALRRDMGKPYDELFEWSDNRIYCSELVWRVYNKTLGMSVGKVQLVKDLAYDRPVVRALIDRRFGKRAVGEKREALLREKIITPIAMKGSDLLVTVFEGVVR